MKNTTFPVLPIAIFAAIFAAGLTAAAQAQTYRAAAVPNIGITAAPIDTAAAAAVSKSFFNEIKLSGSQTDGGRCAADKNVCRGNTFVVSGFSAPFSVVLTVSVEHDGVVSVQGKTAPARGSWMMVVSKAGKYIGTLFGDIQDGKANWAEDMFTGVKTGRAAEAGLRILGGFDGYKEVESNDVSTLAFSAFTNFAGDMSYTEASLAKVF